MFALQSLGKPFMVCMTVACLVDLGYASDALLAALLLTFWLPQVWGPAHGL